MGIVCNPSMVTDGLIACYDIANPRCYINNATQLNDLSIRKGVMNLYNSPTFSNLPPKIQLDGTNEYSDFYVQDLLSSLSIFTVEVWLNLKSYTENKSILQLGQYYGVRYIHNTGFGFTTTNIPLDLFGISSVNYNNLNLTNKWTHFVFIFNLLNSYTNNKIYINTLDQSLSQLTGSELLSGRTVNGSVWKPAIAYWPIYSGYAQMDFSMYRIYNRELTLLEIKENYNTTRGRFS